MSLIPFEAQMYLGMLFGKFLYKVLKKRKKVVICNIEKCFPNLKREEKDNLAKENFIRLGQAIFEICNSYHWSDKKYLKKIKDVIRVNI